MKDTLIIDGKEFISSRRAAEITRYTNDYVGQLCRQSKVVAKRFGRVWFIDRDSILQYKKSQDNLLGISTFDSRVDDAPILKTVELENLLLDTAHRSKLSDQNNKPETKSQSDIVWDFKHFEDISQIKDSNTKRELDAALVNIKGRANKAIETFGKSLPTILVAILLSAGSIFSAYSFSYPDQVNGFIEKNRSRTGIIVSQYSAIKNQFNVSESQTANIIDSSISDVKDFGVSAYIGFRDFIVSIFGTKIKTNNNQFANTQIYTASTTSPITTIINLSSKPSSQTSGITNQSFNYYDTGSYNYLTQRVDSLQNQFNNYLKYEKEQNYRIIESAGKSITNSSPGSSNNQTQVTDLSQLTGTLGIDHGGTGVVSLLSGLIYSDGTSTLNSTTSPLLGSIFASSTTANNVFIGNVGVGTTSPLSKLDIYGDVILSGISRYLNFGSISGSSGYGIRDNGGIIEFKNTGGTWLGIGSGGGGGSDGNWSYFNGSGIRLATSSNVVLVGANSTTTSSKLEVIGSGYFSGNLGIGTTSPWRTLSVKGNSDLGNNALAGSFTATSTTASVFPYASSTAVTVSGNLYLNSYNGPLQANNGVVSATTSIGVVYGGTGVSTFGQGWIYSSGGTTALSASTSPTVNYLVSTSTTATSTFAGPISVIGSSGLNVLTNGHVGIGTTTPYTQLSVAGNIAATGLTLSGITGSTQCLRVNASGIVSGTGADCSFSSGTAYDWLQQTNTFGVNSLTPTSTIPIWIQSTATSTFAGGIESWDKIGAPYFNATSSTATSTFAGGLNVAGSSGLTVLQNGYIGINNSSPIYPLDVAGDVKGKTFYAYNSGSIFGGSTFQSSIVVQGSGNSTFSGKVGMGTTSPFATLSISGSSGQTTPIFAVSTSTTGFATSTAFIIDSNGKVGIGTTSPYAQLSVAGIGAFDSLNINSTTATSTFSAGIQATYLNLTGAIASSTFSNGINLSNGCYSINGVCISGSSLTSLGSSNKLAYWTSASNITYGNNLNWLDSSSRLGIGTTTPNWNLQIASSSSPTIALTDTGASSNAKHWTISNTGGNFYISTSSDSLNANSTYMWFDTNNYGTYLGKEAGRFSSIVPGFAEYNTYIGYASGHGIHSWVADSNTGVGAFSLFSQTTGYNNTALGYKALYNNLDGDQNIAIGDNVGSNIINSGRNIIIGTNIDMQSDSGSQLNIGNIIFGNGIDGFQNSISSGNIGIGTTSPFGRFSVNGSNAGTVPLFVVASSTAGFATSTAFVIDSNGKVGIGTTSPYTQLSVAGNIAATGLTLSGITGSTQCLRVNASGIVSGTGADCSSSSGAAYDWLQQTNTFGVNSLTPTSTIPIWVKSTATSTFAGGIESWDKIGAPYFNATSSTATSTLNGGLRAGGTNGLSVLQNGIIGIGSSSPMSLLGIAGNSNVNISFGNGTVTGYVGIDSSNPSIDIGTYSNHDVRLETGGVERFRVSSLGNIGVGTTSPYAKLSVVGSAAATTALAVYGFNSQTAPLMLVASTTGSATSTAFIIDSNGKVGIGTTTPYTQLSVAGNIAATGLTLSGITGSTQCLRVDASGIVSGTGADCSSSSGGAAYDWLQQTNTFGVNSLTPTSTIPIWVKSTATSTFAGGIESWSKIGAPYFMATSTTATSTFNGGLVVGSSGLTVLQSGNVGIGTITAADKLSIAGQVTITTDNTFTGGTGSSSGFRISSYNTKLYQNILMLYGKGKVTGTNAGTWQFNDGTNDTVTFLTGGNVGIGTTSPYSILSISNSVSTTANTPLFTIASTTNGTATSTALTVLANGNVGIAISNPGYTLDVTGSMNTQIYRVGGLTTLNSPNATSLTLGGTASYQTFIIGSSQKTSYFAGGNVGIGTTSPYAKLSVVGSAAATTTLAVYGFNSQTAPLMLVASTTGSATSTAFILDNNGQAGIATSTPWRTLSVNGTVAMPSITVAGASGSAVCLAAGGELQVNSGAQTCTVSSAKFKHDIESQISGLDTIRALRPVSFKYNNDSSGSERLGLIAEEVNRVDPRLIFTGTDNEPRGVRYEDLTSVLTRAVQELDTKVDDNASTTLDFMKSSKLSVDSSLNKFTQHDNQLTDITKQISDMDIRISDIASSTSTIASTTIDAISHDQSFIEVITNKVKEYIASAGEWVVSKISSVLAVFDRVETKTAAVSNGIEMTDSATKEVWCVRIQNGDWNKLRGKCGDVTSEIKPEVTPVLNNINIVSTTTVENAINTETSTTTTVTNLDNASTTPVSSSTSTDGTANQANQMNTKESTTTQNSTPATQKDEGASSNKTEAQVPVTTTQSTDSVATGKTETIATPDSSTGSSGNVSGGGNTEAVNSSGGASSSGSDSGSLDSGSANP